GTKGLNVVELLSGERAYDRNKIHSYI
ncbi:MAG: hypothetical protein RL028_718, partial [Actinomycetota bacterium]